MVLFSLRTGAEPSFSAKLSRSLVLLLLVHSNDAFKALSAIISLNMEMLGWDSAGNKWKKLRRRRVRVCSGSFFYEDCDADFTTTI